MTLRSQSRLFGDMAYSRQVFIDKLQQHLVGAIGEFYKARVAAKNGHTKYVRHWNTEVRGLLTSFVAVALHPVRGFTDRDKAIARAIAEVKAGDARYRRYAESVLPRNYRMAVRKGLDDTDTAAFWAMVDRVVP